MTSLKTLLALKTSILYPAHGPAIVGRDECAAHISEYITHRQEREDQIVSLLQSMCTDPTKFGKTIDSLIQGIDAERQADAKFKQEYLSGKPFVPPKKKPEDEAKEEEESKAQIEARTHYPAEEKALPIPLICRILYKSNKDALIYAAGRSVEAHLIKLEGEGKVRRKGVVMPKIVEGKIRESVEQEGWEWAAEVHSEKLDEHLKVE